MSFICVSRLTVTGPRPQVVRFRRDARRRLSVRFQKVRQEQSVAFSLERLFQTNRLPVPEPDGLPTDVFDFANHAVGGHFFTYALRVAEWHGYARLSYHIEVKNYELWELLIPLSRCYPELCFVDSQLSLDSGTVEASFITRGRCSRWTLPETRCNAQWRRAAEARGIPDLEEAYENDEVRSDAEEAMIEEALGHWDKHVLRTLRRRDEAGKTAPGPRSRR